MEPRGFLAQPSGEEGAQGDFLEEVASELEPPLKMEGRKLGSQES